MFRKIFRKITIPRPPDLGLLIQIGAFVGAVSIAGAVGFALGASSDRPCTAAITLADRRDVTQENLAFAVRVRGDAVGREDFADADVVVNGLIAEDDEMRADYLDEKAKCAGGAS